MTLESAQLLSAVSHKYGIEAPYKATHKNHPCTIWAGLSESNWSWLLEHAFAISDEFTSRYGKVHKSLEVIKFAKENKPSFEEFNLTAFAQAMPDKYKSSDVVLAYRNYYLGEKRSIATWKYSKTPDWWIDD